MYKLGLAFTSVLLLSSRIWAQEDIHSINFKNFTYQPFCTDLAGNGKMEKITVKNGEFSREKKQADYVDRFYFEVRRVTYGDLTGDGKDEAVVLSNCNTGGTGQFTEGFIYGITGGKVALLARIPGGDRADGGLRMLTVENGLLVVEANDSQVNSGACCPEGSITQKQKLQGGKLVDVGIPLKRELYVKERLTFDRGASSKTFTVKVSPEDRKRYTVGARAGQLLSVAINTADLTLGLMGDTETTEGKNSFTARLPKNGDYTFEISNYGEKEIEVTITVKIQ